MIPFTDQMNRKVEINFPPKRIISLVPSQTELLHDLGIEEEVVGITKFCIHPEKWFRTKTRVGGTKKLNFEKIEELKPDLIIGNKEENQQEQIETLMKDYPVWMSEIKTLDQSLDMIRKVGEITGKADRAEQIIKKIITASKDFRYQISDLKSISTAYLIWKDPYMSINHDTFIDHIMQLCKLENVFINEASRYPEISIDSLKKANPGLILLSSEPYPFKEKHLKELEEICPDAQIMLVDGEMFSWYGSRLQYAFEYFLQLLKEIHPQ